LEAARIPNHQKHPKPYLVPFSPQEPEISTPKKLQELLSAAMWPNKTPEEIAEIHSRKAAKLERMREATKGFHIRQEAIGRRMQITKDAAASIGKIVAINLTDETSIVGVCGGYTESDPYHKNQPNLPYNKVILNCPDFEIPQEISTHDIASIHLTDQQLPFVWEGDQS
jgi:hypothetical protein